MNTHQINETERHPPLIEYINFDRNENFMRSFKLVYFIRGKFWALDCNFLSWAITFTQMMKSSRHKRTNIFSQRAGLGHAYKKKTFHLSNSKTRNEGGLKASVNAKQKLLDEWSAINLPTYRIATNASTLFYPVIINKSD